MSNGHGSSRRQAYGRRMKDLRTRKGTDVQVDLEGPEEWNRGDAWDDEQSLPPATIRIEPETTPARSR